MTVFSEKFNTRDASPSFMAELDKMIDSGDSSYQDPRLVQFHEDLPAGTSHSKTVAYNQTFGTNLKGKLLCIGGPGIGRIGRDDEPLGFDVLWHSKDLIIKTVLETGGDTLHKKLPISDDLDTLKESEVEATAAKIPEMLASSEAGDDQVGNYFDPKGEKFF